MPDESLRKLLGLQRRRLLATILGHAERELYPDLTEHQQGEFRAKVLEATQAYHDVMNDILGAADSDQQVINVEAIELLRQIRERMPEGV